MKLRTPTPDLLARAFADAVASGDHDAAEGWLTLAAYRQERDGLAGRRRWGPERRDLERRRRSLTA